MDRILELANVLGVAVNELIGYYVARARTGEHMMMQLTKYEEDQG